MAFRLPKTTDRTIVLGRTGSGKTVFSAWLLSKQRFDIMPWVIIDYKGDELIAELVNSHPDNIKIITPYDKPPRKPGLYWMQPVPIDDDTAVEAWLRKVWAQEYMGLFVDEGYALPQKAAFDIILTQGRSKHIPVIALYQRPVYMSRYAVAQANFFAAFDQNDERDLLTTSKFIKAAYAPDGSEITLKTELPDYYSLWYDVGQGKTTLLEPCPPDAFILETFNRRLGNRNKGSML